MFNFEPTRDFTRVHNAIFTLYTRLPDFKSSHAMLYVYLMARSNPQYGYAFPSTEDIALALNCGINQVVSYKRVLKDYGLIVTKRHSTYGNDMYYVKPPITEEAEFYGRFPEAREHYEKRSEQFAARKSKPEETEQKSIYDGINW
ncbi:helix-turn-helix domain-containing protein [Paenibacillus pinihumi]|uniref:helix-turn-helix domain-containing protein n=1 Tax=Paenibacillus pinihumi TaxID=669462 RepID=UPI00048E6393|nr:helix-turn-helix domain-containing protein [Paenibacillus pinihumi]